MWELEGEAGGYCLQHSFTPASRWEFDVRYDVYNRMTDVSARERQFKIWILGA